MAISNPDVIWKLNPDTLFYKFVFNPVTNLFFKDWGNNNFCWLFWRTVMICFMWLVSSFLTMTTVPGFLIGLFALPAWCFGFPGLLQFYASIDAWLQTVHIFAAMMTGVGLVAAGAAWVVSLIVGLVVLVKYLDERFLAQKREARQRERWERERAMHQAIYDGTYEKPVTMADTFYEFYKSLKMKYCPTIVVAEKEEANVSQG
jgi:hypothetical protein